MKYMFFYATLQNHEHIIYTMYRFSILNLFLF